MRKTFVSERRQAVRGSVVFMLTAVLVLIAVLLSAHTAYLLLKMYGIDTPAADRVIEMISDWLSRAPWRA